MNRPFRKSLIAAAALALTAGTLATPALADRNGDRGWFTADRAQVTEQMNAAAERYGLQPVAYVEADDGEFEAYTQDRDGNPAKIELDRLGNVEEIEIEYGFNRRGWVDAFASQDDLRRGVEDAGFEFMAIVDQKKRHYEVMARAGNGEMAELHVDFGGRVYKAKFEPREFGMSGWLTESPRGERDHPRGRGPERDHPRGPGAERGPEFGPGR